MLAQGSDALRAAVPASSSQLSSPGSGTDDDTKPEGLIFCGWETESYVAQAGFQFAV